MTNRERYQAAFAGVRPPADTVQQALERQNTPARPRRRRLGRTLLVLAAGVGSLSLPVRAGGTAGTGSNLPAPPSGGAQTELVDSIGYPVDASVTVNGYTLTAEAVIGDQYNVAMVYTLTREDGEPIPQGAYFADRENSLHRGSGGGYLEQVREGLPENQMQLVETWTGDGALPFLRNVQVVFRDLTLYQEGEEPILLAEGEWELKFTARYRDATVSVPVDNLTVTGTEGKSYQLRKIQLSPLGVHMDLIAPNDIPKLGDPPEHAMGLLSDFTVSLQLSDGTILPVGNANRGGGGSMDDETIKAHYGALFDQPIPLEDVSALIICGTQVPVDAG